MTNHHNWACTAQTCHGNLPPLKLATCSKPLVEIQCYSPLERIEDVCGLWGKWSILSRAHCQSIPTALSSTPPPPRTRSIAWQRWLQQYWQDPAAPEGVMRLCIPVAMLFWITQRRLEAALDILFLLCKRTPEKNRLLTSSAQKETA